MGGRGVCSAQTCTDARSARKTAHVGTTRPTPRSKWLRRCAFSDLCRSSAVSAPPGGGIGVRVLPASCVLVPKRDACAFLVQQEKPTTQPASHATVSYIAEKLVSLRFGCRSRYISRYVNLKLGFLPFVVASIVAMVFFSAVFAARAPAMGNSADRAWQLSQLVEGGLTACNPSHGSLSCVKTNSVSFASAQAQKLNHSVCFSFPHEVGYFVGTPFIARRCVSKQIGRHDAACQGCPRCVSRSPVLGTPQSRMALWGEEKQRSD